MAKDFPIQVVLVPQGAEHQAVQRAFSKAGTDRPKIVPIPAGPVALRRFLASDAAQSWRESALLLMGLGGSLTPACQVGDRVLLKTVWDSFAPHAPRNQACNSALTTWLAEQLPDTPVVTGVTTARVITTLVEKRHLGEHLGASVVDMESAVLLAALPQAQIAILRVISDDCNHDLPDIAGAIGADGQIRVMTLAIAFLKQPLAALRFIRSARHGLKALETLASELLVV